MNKSAIKHFEKALNEAVVVATKKNIPPLSGNILILCAVGSEMTLTKMTKSQAGRKVTTALEVGLLLSLMCETASENVTFLCYGESKIVEEKCYDESTTSLLVRLNNQEKVLVSQLQILRGDNSQL